MYKFLLFIFLIFNIAKGEDLAQACFDGDLTTVKEIFASEIEPTKEEINGGLLASCGNWEVTNEILTQKDSVKLKIDNSSIEVIIEDVIIHCKSNTSSKIALRVLENILQNNIFKEKMDSNILCKVLFFAAIFAKWEIAKTILTNKSLKQMVETWALEKIIECANKNSRCDLLRIVGTDFLLLEKIENYELKEIVSKSHISCKIEGLIKNIAQ